MPENSWPENNPLNNLEPDLNLNQPSGEAGLELSRPEATEAQSLFNPALDALEDTQSPIPTSYAGRRRKAAVLLIGIWSGTIALHLVSWGVWAVMGLTLAISLHMVRVFWARPGEGPEPRSLDNLDSLPLVSLVVSAKNEETVIGGLVEMLCSLDYPRDRYEVWAINDQSTDNTALVLDQLLQEYPQLRVLHRQPGATGGKSGALNQVLPLTQGDIVAVFDADAQVTPDLLRRVLPMFDRDQVGAVQMRKAIANLETNFWTRGQMAEMAVDSWFQQQRITIGGIGELRGNGQFVRREALLDCGGWNEETITDDLDLTIRLHLQQWDIEFLLEPAVKEEGVTRTLALWHQRNRWAEGGYQRYLDYWRPLFRNRLGFRKSWDMLIFWIVQYFLPNTAVPDCLMAILRNRPPIFAPTTAMVVVLSAIAMFTGLRRIRKESGRDQSVLVTLIQTLRGTLYMFHWLVVIASASARMSVRPKRLKWVKTVHVGLE